MNQTNTAQLPSMPGTVIKLLRMFADPEAGLNDIVDTIKPDAALAGRILKAANSSVIAAGREVTDLKRAAALLGRKTISTLALSFSLADQSTNESHGRLFNSFWNQSLITGVAASVLAAKHGGLHPDEAFMIGLLSRIGRLGAISFAPEEFAACAEVAVRSGCGLDTMCLTGLGMDCEELTLHYMRSWKLPAMFIEHIAAMQEAGQRDRTRGTAADIESRSQTIEISTSLRIAAAIGQFCSAENSGIALATIHELLAPASDTVEQDVEMLIAEVTDEFAHYSEILNVDPETVGTPAELHARAMANLVEIAISPEPDQTNESATASSEVAWLQDRVKDLAEQLTLDAMTSVHNRSHFDHKLEERIDNVRHRGGFVAVLFIDINNFKKFNDSYGHDIGDAAICCVAQRLKTATRNNDIVARYGGDEFVILCEMNSYDGLQSQADRLTELMRGLSISSDKGELPVCVAIGGAIGAPDGHSDFGARLLRASDHAMYQAKERRRNPVVIGISTGSEVTQSIVAETAVMT